MNLEVNDQIGAAASYQGLGVLYQMLDDLDRAEDYLQQALAVYATRNMPDVYKVYHYLAGVSRARGDTNAATEWQAKHDAKVAELERLHRGDDTPVSVPAQMKDAILALARVVHDVRPRGVSLPADAAEALAQLSRLPAPLGAVGVFLRDVAEGASPAVPSGLPSEIEETLERLRQAQGS